MIYSFSKQEKVEKLDTQNYSSEVGAKRRARYRRYAHIPVTHVVFFVPLAGCSPQGVAQSATATASSQATQATSSAPTVVPSTLQTTPTIPLSSTEVIVPVTSTEGILAVTPVASPEGTEGPRPTPTGAAPDPLSLLNIFQFYSGSF